MDQEDEVLLAQRYATRREQYVWWLDHILTSIRLPPALGIAMLVFAVYVTGLVIALTIGFGGSYISSFPIYLGCIGLGLVLGTEYWAAGEVHRVYEHLRPIFAVSDQEYLSTIDLWLNRLRQGWGHVRWVVFAGACVLGAVYVGFFRVDLQHKFNVISLRPKLFPIAWFAQPHITIKAGIIAFYGLCIAIALGSSARLLCINLLFLLSLRRLPVIPLPSVIRVRLRPVTDMHVRMAMAWLFGVSLFGVLFYGSYDIVANGVIIWLFSIGIFTFLIPQLVFRGYLLKAYSGVCTFALFSFHRRFGVRLEERWPQRITQYTTSRFAELQSIPEMIEATGRPGMWVYDTQDVVGWLAVQAIALVILLAQGFLGKAAGL